MFFRLRFFEFECFPVEIEINSLDMDSNFSSAPAPVEDFKKPFEKESLERSEKKSNSGIIFEPDEITVMNAIVSEYVAGQLVAAARESFACEVAARRCAMDSAGKNAQEMIDSLKLTYNRARQAVITQEITEIVSGAEAL